jgi:hypothetical protein
MDCLGPEAFKSRYGSFSETVRPLQGGCGTPAAGIVVSWTISQTESTISRCAMALRHDRQSQLRLLNDQSCRGTMLGGKSSSATGS